MFKGILKEELLSILWGDEKKGVNKHFPDGEMGGQLLKNE